MMVLTIVYTCIYTGFMVKQHQSQIITKTGIAKCEKCGAEHAIEYYDEPGEFPCHADCDNWFDYQPEDKEPDWDAMAKDMKLEA